MKIVPVNFQGCFTIFKPSARYQPIKRSDLRAEDPQYPHNQSFKDVYLESETQDTYTVVTLPEAAINYQSFLKKSLPKSALAVHIGLSKDEAQQRIDAIQGVKSRKSYGSLTTTVYKASSRDNLMGQASPSSVFSILTSSIQRFTERSPSPENQEAESYFSNQ